MNPVARKVRRFRSLRAQQGSRAALRATAASLRNSFVYRWQQVRPRVRSLRSTEPAAVRAPDNDRFPLDAFLPAVEGRGRTVAAGSVAVVVPVYRGADTTRDCIESVLAAPSPAVGEVIVVDDASPEAAVAEYLDELEQAGRVHLLRNLENIGFVASVNCGMQAAGERDVILLNSDTVVAGDWADHIAAHAGAARVGTVTPFSNNATICSYPGPGSTDRLPAGETVASMSAAFAAANGGRACELPTGVGFCMFISRECLEDVGPFDEETFGKGYGEENDFCLRATGRGWRHLLAADAFVWHRGEVSFGSEAGVRQAAALELLRERYPGYLASVARHVEDDPARPWRVAATATRFRTGRRPVVLAVLHAHGTGTEKHAFELMRRYRDEVRFLVLRPTFEGPVRLWSPDPDDGLDLRVRMAGDVRPLTRLVTSFGVRRVHVHHTLGMPFDVREFVRALGVPFDFTVHDFFAICPRVRLTTPDNDYCGGPSIDGCGACLASPPPAPAGSIDAWRRKNGWLLSEAERVICPSRDAAGHVAASTGGAELIVAPHDTLDHEVFPPVEPPALGPDERLRVALIGVLSDDKGARRVGECLRRLDRGATPPDVRLIGFVPDEYASLIRGTSLRATGPYAPEELPGLLARARPHVVWFPASWPETYSYTLSEAMAARLPVMVPDIGAFTERVESRSWSWLVPWDLRPEECAEAFAGIADQLRQRTWGGASLTERASSLPAPQRYPVAALEDFYDHQYLSPLIADVRSGDGV